MSNEGAKSSGGTRRQLRLAIKRAIDLFLSVVLLLLLLPLLLCLAIAVRSATGPPVFFRQRRIGLFGHEFVLFKLRTMKVMAESSLEPSTDEFRLTVIGRFLRRTSLDELPALVNVARGEMSIVGPRPLLPEYRNRYTADQWRRHEMRPGLAGPVAAYGRNSLSWEEKFKWDVWYVDNWSLRLDLRLMRQTLVAMLSRRGVSAPAHATMPEFTGSDGHRQADG